MINSGEQRRLRLVTSHSTEKEESDTEPNMHKAFRNFVQCVYLPFSKETLWLRMDTSPCGGMYLYYIRHVDVRLLEEHKPYYHIGPTKAEEIVFSRYVRVGRIHRFFGISILKLVLKNVHDLRKNILRRDFHLQQSINIREYFKDVFGV